jgi:hypothetical protein
MTDEQTGEGAAPANGADEVKGAQRVILRGVEVVVLDDLTAAVRKQVLELVGAERAAEGWLAVAARTGTPESTVAAYAGKSGDAESVPGTYKAVPYGAWFVRTQRVEPPLS